MLQPWRAESISCHDGMHPESIAKPRDDHDCRCDPLYYFICNSVALNRVGCLLSVRYRKALADMRRMFQFVDDSVGVILNRNLANLIKNAAESRACHVAILLFG
jgi:hypothetical protein